MKPMHEWPALIWLDNRVRILAERALVNIYLRRSARQGWNLPRAHQFVHDALVAIDTDLEAMSLFHKSEQQILSERLGRRYDPGAALNEAAERALAAKRAAGGKIVTPADTKVQVDDFWSQEAARQQAARAASPEPTFEQTSNQKRALEHQKRYLKGIVEKS